MAGEMVQDAKYTADGVHCTVGVAPCASFLRGAYRNWPRSKEEVFSFSHNVTIELVTNTKHTIKIFNDKQKNRTI